MKTLFAIDKRLNTVVIVMTELLLVAMFGITIANVLLRKAFEINILWAYDVLRALFVGFVFFAASVVTYRREHANFVFVLEKLPLKGQHLFQAFSNIVAAVFYGVVGYYGYHVCVNVFGQKMPASGISATLLYVLMEAAMIIMALHCLIAALDYFMKMKEEGKEAQ